MDASKDPNKPKEKITLTEIKFKQALVQATELLEADGHHDVSTLLNLLFGSLLTTIESQQEEIKKKKRQIDWLQQIDGEREVDFKLHAQSLKTKSAITELAVKEIKNELSFAIMFDHKAAIVRLQDSLAEIERLNHGN